MIRVLHIFSPTFGRRFSGHDKRWLRQYQNWREGSVQHLILYPGGGIEISGAIFLKPKRKLQDRSSNNNWTRVNRAFWALKVLIDIIMLRSEYDVLHVHVSIWGGLLAAPVANYLKRPCLYEISLIGSDNPSALRKESLGKLKVRCYKSYDFVLTTSKAARDDCYQFGFSNKDVELITNPVDTDMFAPIQNPQDRALIRDKFNIPATATTILFVGSIKKRKGVDILIEAFIGLSMKHDDLHLVLVGPASHKASPGVDSRFVQSIRQRINQEKISNQVDFVGRVDDDRTLADYYRAADIMAFPSRSEGMPNALLEGMSSGLPVVATALPGVTDTIIQDGRNGYLVPIDHAQALLNKLSLLISEHKKREKLGMKARQYVIEQHGFENWQTRMENLYASILQ